MGNHTPGPWLPVKLEIPGHVFWVAVHEDGRLTEKGEEGEANARLIASAPELLAALDALLRQTSNPDPIHPSWRKARADAEAAIFRAKAS